MPTSACSLRCRTRRRSSSPAKLAADSKLINARVADRPLAGRVQLPGYITSEQREQLFKGALAFVMPSHTEGFGMPVVEAMTAGVPVIAADRGALPEVAGRAARFFEPDDIDGLTALLKTIILDARNASQRCVRAGSSRPPDSAGDRRRRRCAPPGRWLWNRGGARVADRPLHIAIDGRELFGKPTGVGRYLLEVLKEWAQVPHRYTVIVARRAHDCPAAAGRAVSVGG